MMAALVAAGASPCFLLLLLVAIPFSSSAFVPSSCPATHVHPRRQLQNSLLSSASLTTTPSHARKPSHVSQLHSTNDPDNCCNEVDRSLNGRRSFLSQILIPSATTFLLLPTFEASALVKGNAPPPKKKSSDDGGSSKPKCTNVEECQEQAERLAALQDEELRATSTPPKVAPLGSRYKDLQEGSSDVDMVKTGDEVEVRYKVLKLGKRSYDGLSGEGTVVFSRGYGLEDDETKPGVQSFTFTLGDPTVITALNDAVPGMRPSGIRRIGILPQMGWEKPGKACDGGPGGSGAGGDLKTDYVVVPTATMVATETCFDKSKLPFPTTYAEQRRMAQRFDQSLIVEVELVGKRS